MFRDHLPLILHAPRDSPFSSLRCLFVTALTSARLQVSKYPKELNTLGDHLRKRRLDLGLLQQQVADQIGVNVMTILNWERNTTSPSISHIPAIIRFIGYDPLPNPSSLPEHLRQARSRLGLSQAGMAKRLGVDPTTLRKLEQGRDRLSRKLRNIITTFAEGCRPTWTE